MSRHAFLARLSLLLPVLVLSACATTGAPQKCATVDTEPILRDSLAAMAARNRLNNEFDPRFATAEPLRAARKRAEKALLDARDGKQPDEVIKPLRKQYDEARAAETAVWYPVDEAYKLRRKAVLDKLVERIDARYKALGTERGYDLLYQVGWTDPAHVLNPRGGSRNCQGGRDDLTKDLIAVLDRDELQLP